MEMGNIQDPLLPNGNGKRLPSMPLIYPTKPPENPDDDDLNLRQLLTVFKRRALVIAGVAIAVTSGIGFWSFRQEPKYESRFQLLVEPVTAEGGKLNKLAQVPGVTDVPYSVLDYDTQIQVLRSPNLMSPILKEIQKRYPDVSYDSLITSTKLKIGRLEETKILEVRYRDTDAKKVREILHQVARGYLRYSLQERQMNLKKGIEFVDSQLPQLRLRVDKLQADLQAFRQRNELLDPESQSQQLAMRVNTIEQQQVDTQVKIRENQSLYATLTSQLGLQPEQAIATTSLSEAPRYQQLLNQLQEIEAKIAKESARFTEDSPTIVALRNQQRNLLPLLEQESQKVIGTNLQQAGVTNDSPSSIRNQLSQQLVDAANQIQVLQMRQKAIAQAERLLNQQVRQMPVVARQYTDLQRELNVATESLNRFLGVREGLQIEVAQKSLPWEIILKPEVPKFPVSPNNERNLILGAIAGLLLGTVVALMVERLDNVFHSPDELKDRTKLPLLGVIPYSKQLKEIMPAATLADKMPEPEDATPKKGNRRQPQWYKASPFLESFRSLHTNIRFLGSDTPIHSIVISSATPGDGKSTVSVHLAQAAAAMGQRVLLVDADLRLPQVHKVLGLENQIGLSNVIATGCTAKQAIQRLPMWDHLYVLTAGQLPPDPTRLLSSKKMLYLMEQFHAVFDLVIYDTPPVLGLADGQLLAAHTNGVVMVGGLGKTDRSMMMQSLDRLRISNATVLGVVANGVKGYTTQSYYHYQHYYAPTESEVMKAKKLLQKRMG
ncbi:GumC family protein [Allocoleopsis franciscana]|uniref:Capsular exopolysaccharide biosynthesis protein n=1 Tax=Allocoleopsis franciscana PCC 7113 TaxID=1173027 RepID=K9WIC5_9CYAN|nr:capsular exopolysaccharide biosynthesis protein [Allocoleopsis franciscana PCC 7113]